MIFMGDISEKDREELKAIIGDMKFTAKLMKLRRIALEATENVELGKKSGNMPMTVVDELLKKTLGVCASISERVSDEIDRLEQLSQSNG